MHRRLVAVIAALLVALVVPDVGASAQGSAKPTIRLASQTAWVGRGETFRLGLTADDGGRDGLEVTVSVHRPLTSRTEFQRTIDGTIGGSAFKTATAELSELRPEPGSVFRVELQVQDPAQPRDPQRIVLRNAGVYPVRVELGEQGGGRVLASFVTHLVYMPDPVEGPQLSLAWVTPVHARPGTQPSGVRRLPAAAASALATLAIELEQRPDLPMTIKPTPETLDSLGPGSRSADPETLERLQRVVRHSRRQVVGDSYVPVPLSIFTGPLQDEASASLATGNERLDALLGQSPDGRTRIVSNGVTEAGLARLRDQQVDKVVLPESLLTPVPGQRVTLALPFELGARQGRRVQAAASDDALAAHFRAGSGAVLAAHQLLADLAVIYFDSPGRTRGVVAVPPRTWVPGAAFLAAFLDGLTSAPIVEPVTLDELFAIGPATSGRNRPLVRTLRADAPAGASSPVAAIQSARARLDAFGTILDPGEPIHARLDRTLLVAPSLDLRAGERSAYANGVVRIVTNELRRVGGPAQRSITLTARRGRIPVTVQKDVGYPVRIVIRVEGDQLQFPGGSTRALRLTRRNTTELFTVQARSSGAFPLTVTLESPDGRLTLSTSRFTVRSTAASGLGLVLSIGAGAVLLAWWARSFSKRRRGATVD